MSKIEDKGSVAGASPEGRRRKVAAVAAGLVLVQAIGGGVAWASGSLSSTADPTSPESVVEQAGRGGEMGMGASIPTASDGKSTWSVPASQMVMVEDGKAAPSEVSFTLLPVDPTDEAAVEAVTASLPEAEREAARRHLAAKRDDPSSNKVSSSPVKPEARPDSGSSSQSSKKWGILKDAWDETVLVSKAWDEAVVIKEAWTETILDTPEKVDYIEHPATYKTIKEKVGVKYVADDGREFTDENACGDYCFATQQSYSVLPVYKEKQVIDKEAWTETVVTPAKYKEVHHPAVTETKRHEAVYETVHHDAVWGWI